jgi:lipid A 3-O-deacylase
MKHSSFTRLVGCLLGLTGIVAIGAGQAVAQPTPPTGAGADAAPPPAEAAPRVRPGIWENGIGHGFRRGTTETGFGLGIGLGAGTFGTKERHRLVLGAVRVGRMLGGLEAEDRWYRGNAELIAELWGGIQYRPLRRLLFGLTPLLRYNFATGSPWVPFINGGVGIAYTNIGGPDLSDGFQFSVQVGAGVHYFFREDTALTLQYRWFHLSNAGLNRPNTGLNSQIIYTGLERFF